MNDEKTDPGRTSAFLEAAYSLGDDEAMQRFYRDWASEYDHQMQEGLAYLSPQKIATLLMRYIEDTQARILDVGCGTGLTSVALAESGFRRLDGLDFSPAMLEQSRQRGFYSTLIEADLNLPLSISDASYDALISSGTFTHGHVGANALDELFRILKPGGYLACTIHRDIWQPLGFGEKLTQLEEAGIISIPALEESTFFAGGPAEGRFLVVRKSGD